MSAGEGWKDQVARQTNRELHPKLLGIAGASCCLVCSGCARFVTFP